jgi:hypothetical protein
MIIVENILVVVGNTEVEVAANKQEGIVDNN